MEKNKNNKRIGKFTWRISKELRNVLVVLGVLTTILVIIDFTPFGGNLRFYAKWIECGNKPVSEVLEIGFGAGSRKYTTSPSFHEFPRFQPAYFCKPIEAERAGFSASDRAYDFPHIRNGEY